jgi:hypothetical protein
MADPNHYLKMNDFQSRQNELAALLLKNRNGGEDWGEMSHLGGYDCADYGKVISARDASALAEALELAAQQGLPAPRTGPVLLREGMTAEEHRWANAPLGPDFVHQFVAFLRKGEFSFYWDD